MPDLCTNLQQEDDFLLKGFQLGISWAQNRVKIALLRDFYEKTIFSLRSHFDFKQLLYNQRFLRKKTY